MAGGAETFHTLGNTVTPTSRVEQAHSLPSRNHTLGIYIKEHLANVHPESRKSMFIAVTLSLTIKRWKQPTYPSVIEEKKDLSCINRKSIKEVTVSEPYKVEFSGT